MQLDETVIYEIYVRSFRDSDGDGLGDLPGVLEKLDHVADLGANALWLTPIHPSPDADLGYDVADYTAVDPRLGTLEDVDRLAAAAHARGLRVLLDLVLNHTSDRHPWFATARDRYVWRSAPTNWQSFTGGSAWQFDERAGEYYLHTFLPEQPDLDWRNGDVREAIAGAMRFWLDRGIDGFRLDALPLLVKDAQFRDNPGKPVYTVDQPEMTEVVAFLRGVVDEYPDRILAAEMGLPPARAARYYDAGVDVPFNFGLITEPWTAPRLRRRIAAHLEALPPGRSPNWVLGNHDVPRLATRVGPERARVAAVLGLTLPGAVTLYAGDELGLPDGPPHPDGPRDRFGRIDPGRSRDGARAPMPWDGSPHGGFSSGTPWLPAYPDAGTIGVAAQRGDLASPLALHRRLLQLRRARGWARGRVARLESTESELIYELKAAGHRTLVLARVEEGACSLPLPGAGHVLVTARRPDASPLPVAGEIALDGPDAAVVELDAG